MKGGLLCAEKKKKQHIIFASGEAGAFASLNQIAPKDTDPQHVAGLSEVLIMFGSDLKE